MISGEYALQAVEPGWVTARQIEAARRAIVRSMKRHGKVWIRIFPDKPYTQRPPETRMGKGKGNVEYYVAVVKPGRIMFEISGLDHDEAIAALNQASYKFSIKTKVTVPQPGCRRESMKTAEIRLLSTEEIKTKLADARNELMNFRFQIVTGQLTDTSRLKITRRQIAVYETILRERELGKKLEGAK